MNGFLDIASVEVPRRIAEEANMHLREVGRRGMEGFSLWAGRREGNRFLVLENIIPAQTGHQTDNGVFVSVGAEELHRINVWLFEHKMTLFAQLHSHPTNAFHSDTDDTFPIATTVGSLSIVIPNYARQPFSLRSCAIYRLLPDSGWIFVEPAQATEFISIV